MIPTGPAAAPLAAQLAGVLIPRGLLMWSAGGWSGGRVADDDLLLALGGRTVYTLLLWAESGLWCECGAAWIHADGRWLPSPVLAADAVARALITQLYERLPETAAVHDAFDVEALVVVLDGSGVETDATAAAAWQGLPVDVCTTAPSALPGVDRLVLSPSEAPCQPIRALFDKELTPLQARR